MKLTKPQKSLLYALARNPLGITTAAKWVGTGRALVARGLAKGENRRIRITRTGEKLVRQLSSDQAEEEK